MSTEALLKDGTLCVMDVHHGVHRIPLTPPGVLICDIDGTIADLTHRRRYIATKPKNYPAFERTMHLDTPIDPVIAAVKTLHLADWTVIMCSGRGAQNRGVTEEWLARHGVPYHRLYMRAEKDYRKDSIIKAELLDQIIVDGFAPTIIFDDRNQVVEMWRGRGLTCVQVAFGDF